MSDMANGRRGVRSGTTPHRRAVLVLTAAVVAIAGLLGPAPAPAHADSNAASYRFSILWSKSTPVRWDPCRVITWRINYAAGRGFSKELVRVKAAFAELGRTTGITFRYLGTSGRAPFTAAARLESAAILVGFAKPGHSGLRRGSSAIGYGGAGTGLPDSDVDSFYYRLPYVSGQAAWLSTAVRRLSAGQKRALYLHELGHVMGLSHSSARSQIMYPSLNGSTPSHYAAGDRAGLARLGRRQGCVRVPSQPAAPTVVVSGDNLVISVPAVSSPHAVRYRLESLEGFSSSTGSAHSWTVPISTVDNPFGQTTFRVTAINYFGEHTGPESTWTQAPPAP